MFSKKIFRITLFISGSFLIVVMLLFSLSDVFANDSLQLDLKVWPLSQETTSDTIETTGGDVELNTTSGCNLSASFPPEAIINSADVSIGSISEESIASIAPAPSNLKIVSDSVYDFNAETDGQTITTFNKPVTLTFIYTDAQISGLNENSIRVYYWDTIQQDWIIYSDYSLDITNNSITVNTSHFTLFAIMASSYVCGNDVIELTEECDGANLGGQTCVGLGYVSGALTCNSDCTFNISNCATDGGGGGGGGGGGSSIIQPVTGVTFSGKAYPKSTITLLKDAQIAATTVAGANANFQVNLSGLSAGNYIFSIYSEDNKGRRSSLLTFPISITRGATTNVGGIFIAPTIEVDKSEVKRGENIAIFGQSASKGEITILVSSDEEFFEKTQADKNGIYLHNFDTSLLETGQHFTKSKTALNGEISSFSKAVSFLVGTKTVKKEKTEILKGNLNNDNRVNLIDFSILAYWYKRPSPPTKVDLNNDGKVNLVDFSIMAYYWTG